MAGPRRRSLLCALGGLALAAGLGAAYAPAIHAPPVYDSEEIWRDPARRIDALSPASLRRAASEVDLEPSRWLTNATFGLHFLWGASEPGSFRVVNVGLHALAALALFAFLWETLRHAGRDAAGASRAAFLAAALFAWHPLQVESVTFIWQRATVLLGLIGFASMWLLALGLRLRGPRGALLVALSLLGIPLAILAKQNGVMLPVVMGLYAWLFASRRRPIPLLLVALVVGAVAAGIFVLVAPYWFGGTDPLQILRWWHPGGASDWLAHLLTQARVALRLGSLVLLPLPSRLSIVHELPEPAGAWAAAASGVAVVALAAGALAAARRHPLPALGILWYLAFLMPEWIVRVEPMTEHRAYLPSAGLLFLVALAVEGLGRGAGRHPRVAASVATAVLAALLLGTRARNEVWASPLALWTDAVAKAPQSAVAHWNAGDAWAQRGRRHPPASPEREVAWERAERAFRRALSLAPENLLYQDRFVWFQEQRGWREGSGRDEGAAIVAHLREATRRAEERRALWDTAARALRREIPALRIVEASSPGAEGSRSGSPGEAHFWVTHWTLGIRGVPRGSRLEIRCGRASRVERERGGAELVLRARTSVFVEDTPPGEDRGRRECLRTATRSLASHHVAPAIARLVRFQRHFEPTIARRAGDGDRGAGRLSGPRPAPD